MILSALFPHVNLGGGATHGLRYAAVLGAFFWTSHVLAFLAKQAVAQAGTFAVMETGYLVLQFGIYGLIIGRVFKERRLAH